MTSLGIKDLQNQPVRLTSGHRLCAGCAESIIAKQVMMGSEDELVVSLATGCFEVSTTVFPYTSWNVPYIHTAFGNGAATCAGVETAYNALKRKGKVKQDVNFIAFGGDGATYDIGLQALSGAAERGHRMVYVCLNNEAYMNTGIQRSSATTIGTQTTTSWPGSASSGKKEFSKDLTSIMVAHNIPFVAQVSPHNWRDTVQKAQKAFACGGPAFINALSPCPRGWRFASNLTIEMAKLGVQTCVWPLFEVINGKYELTGESARIADGKAEKLSVRDWISAQGRYKHLLQDKNESVVEQMQKEVDRRWNRLIKLTELD